MKTPLKRLVIAVTGDFGNQRTYPKIKHWVEESGGKFATNITPNVTHLICSLEHYKRSSPMGKPPHFGRASGQGEQRAHKLINAV